MTPRGRRSPMSENVPLYRQIYEDLRDSIADGTYPVGARLPSETELVGYYGVSRLTVRRAIADLAADGFLVTEQGRGSFVRKHKLWASNLRSSVTKSFTDICFEAGLKAGARVVSEEIVRSPRHYAQALGVAEGSLLICIRRIRTADDWPIIDEYTYLPYERYEGILAKDLTDASIFQAVQEVGGMRPLHTQDQLISAVNATADQARELNVPTGAALLKRSAIFVGADGKPISVSRSFFVGGRFSFEV